MVKPSLRTKSIGFKVSQDEYVRLDAAAQTSGGSLGEWCREVLLASLERGKPTPAEQTVVSEVLALRTILLNVVFSLAEGKVVTQEEMSALIERADAEKLNKAIQRLQQALPTVPENVR